MAEARLRAGLLALGAALALAGSGSAAEDSALAKARQALASGDGIAAEAELRKAIDAGTPRPAVAAAMGEALLLQGDPSHAREWLGAGHFAAGEEGYGWRMLGRLERAEGNLAAAGRAYDQALRFTPANGKLWVDIGRLRYAGGEQLQAIAAADQALAVAPSDPRALEFRGQLVRDQYGLIPALRWFERGLALSPDDIGLLGEYAATLGELGRAKAMLAVTRRMLAVDPGNPRALFLEAALAARAGKMALARDLLGRSVDRDGQVPATMLLRGVLELEAGNNNLAIDGLDRLARMQPVNISAALVLARAAFVAGDDAEMGKILAATKTPSPYLLRLAARAAERSGDRKRAAALLDRASAQLSPHPTVIDEGEDIRVLAADWAEKPGVIGVGVRYVRKLLGAGSLDQAQIVAERLRAANSGSGDVAAVAGDVRLMRGDASGALELYRTAARVRADAGLLGRMTRALDLLGRAGEADALVEARLAASPTDPGLNRLAAERAGKRHDWRRAAALAGYLIAINPRSPDMTRLLAEARRQAS
jgi:tetratricopeptide (TPR) repeat protein